MVLVLLFCTILIIITILFFLIILSTLRIEVKNYEISNMYSNTSNIKRNFEKKENSCKSNDKISAKYRIKISLNVLDKLRILQLKLNSEKIKNIALKIHLDKTKIKELEREIGLDDIKEIMQIKPKISYMDLKVKVGIDDVLLTTYSVPLICTVISALLPLVVEKNNYNKIKYVVKPIYNTGKVYDLKLNIGIKFKVMRFLNVVYKIYKQKKKCNSQKELAKRKENEKTVKCNV